jgi:hypothetical protein
MRTSGVGMYYIKRLHEYYIKRLHEYYIKRLHEYYISRSSRQDENGSAIPLEIGLYGPTMSYL